MAKPMAKRPSPSPFPSPTVTILKDVGSAPETKATDSETKKWYEALRQHIWPPLWDTFFPPVWSNWALVLVAFWAARIAVRTLKSINRQTAAAEISTRVAAQTLQASRAAVIDIDLIVAHTDYQTGHSTIYFEVHNSGPTKAHIKEQNFYPWHHETVQVWPIQQPFCRDGRVGPLPEVLESHQTAQGEADINKPDFLVAGGRSAWELYTVGGVLLCFSGYVRYSDEAGDEHETRICEAWNVFTKRFGSLPDMPPSYNRRS